MSSEQLADGVNPLDAELAATWDILKGYSGRDTDLGIARRFGDAAAAYSLRDIGAMNGRVVKVRRDSDAAEEDFSANQVASGALETFVQAGTTYGETNATAFSFSGERSGGTTSSNGIDGFTLDVETASAFAGYQLSSTVSSGTTVYISFNASLSEGSGASSPQVKLRSSSISGVGASNTYDVIEGFNSFELTSNDNAAEYFSFSEGDDNKIFTISNVKVSLTSRNGFVETWYDQSGSGNDATQTAAGQQPKIIENGGIVKNVKGFPSLKFESANLTELDIGLLISNLNSVSAYVVTQKDSGDTNRVAGFTQGVSSDNSRFYFPFYSGGTTPNLGYNNSAAKISFGTTLTRTCNLFSAFSGDTNIEIFKNGSSVGTTALVDQAVTATDSKIGQLSNSFRFDGVMSEIFLTTKKLQDDAAVINNDVINYYNL